MFKLCPPALIYVVFSIAQIIIDTIKGLYNTAFMKFVVALLVTFLLNSLCDGGLGIISWIIVFIPFILMTFVVAMLLYIFGMNSTIGAAKKTIKQNEPNTQIALQHKVRPQTVNFFPYYTSSPAFEGFFQNK
jgi:predicted membrane protein